MKEKEHTSEQLKAHQEYVSELEDRFDTLREIIADLLGLKRDEGKLYR
ncbi:MAG: hypothetical protein WBE34_19880 [Candidatus Nitrosopolaris sp.]